MTTPPRWTERQVREDFNAENGAHIPEDICLRIQNPPTKWEVVSWSGDTRVMLPEIDADPLKQVSFSVWGVRGEGALSWIRLTGRFLFTVLRRGSGSSW